MDLIVCTDKNWGIGRDGHLLCHLKEDMKYFKKNTLGKVVVMGRSTLESLPKGEPLKDRINVVLTRRQDFQKEGVIVVHDMEELMEELNNYEPGRIMIIGGASVYNEMMDICDRLLVTKVYKEFDADTFIRNIDEDPNFKVVWSSEVMTEGDTDFQFFEYRRKMINPEDPTKNIGLRIIFKKADEVDYSSALNMNNVCVKYLIQRNPAAAAQPVQQKNRSSR